MKSVAKYVCMYVCLLILIIKNMESKQRNNKRTNEDIVQLTCHSEEAKAVECRERERERKIYTQSFRAYGTKLKTNAEEKCRE